MSNIGLITGWVLSTLISVIFFAGAYSQFNYDPTTDANAAALQFPDWLHTATAISLVFAACLHMVPQSSFATLGTIIMTGMIGGMIVTLLLQGNGLWWTRAFMGVLPWLALYLRDPRFNDLMSFWQ